MKCEICGKEFTKQMALSVHISKSHNTQNYICKICNKSTDKLGFHIKKYHKNISYKEYYDRYLKKNNKDGLCPVCGKETVFLGLTKGYRDHCSTVCSSLDKNVQIKNANTNLERHGYIQPLSKYYIKGVEESKKDACKQKRVNTCLEKYGTTSNLASVEFKETSKQTCLEKYGVDHPTKADITKQHIKESFYKHYGVTHNMKDKNARLKNIESRLVNRKENDIIDSTLSDDDL